MRILVELLPHGNYDYSSINKHHIQAVIYSMLKHSPFDVLHNLRGFKYFTFSDIMPPTDFKEGEKKYLLISSPSSPFIKFLKQRIKEVEEISIKGLKFSLNVKKLPNKLPKKWITASPVVIKKDRNKYFSFLRDTNITFFLERLKENALKKYNSYYNASLYFDGPIFERMKFSKSVAVSMTIREKRFIIIGSMWKVLEIPKISGELKKFYKFLFDCGIGEKNSLGFGCLNEKF
ncbi:MAG TPA: CRISPR-associated endoribonuclease Cas6 [Nanoarchaeota archaeon]|nr:CRISPR-associated endoribonuclease Cas6 [Nanoarchaeota archaeon]